MNDWTAFGRVDADGTVYVKTAEGERVVGSWQAGTPDEGLAHFARRFADLVVGNSDVADVVPLTERSLYIQGKGSGSTNISIYGESKNLAMLVERFGTIGRGDDHGVLARLDPVHQREQLGDEPLFGFLVQFLAEDSERLGRRDNRQ